MSQPNEELHDVPLIYPLISVTFRTVAVVNGRRIDTECETLLNMDQVSPFEATAELGKVLVDFEEYVSKVSGLVNSEQGQLDLQNILDTSEQARSQNSSNPPSTPLSQIIEIVQGPHTAPEDQRADLPDTASL